MYVKFYPIDVVLKRRSSELQSVIFVLPLAKSLDYMLSLLDALYCYAQPFIDKKVPRNTPQRAHYAVILMAVILGCFLTGTLILLVSFILDLQQETVILPILILTAVGFLTPYFYLNALFINKERYLLAEKLLTVRRFDKETFLLLYLTGFVYFVAITYIAGRLNK